MSSDKEIIVRDFPRRCIEALKKKEQETKST